MSWIEDSRIITNNPKVWQKYQGGRRPLEFLEGKTFMDVLLVVRDRIHQGAHLLTHPLSSSIKPGETPFKTVLIGSGEGFDFEGEQIISDSILKAKQLIGAGRRQGLPEDIQEDFATIDLSIVESLPGGS